jgi:hypothetical protein
MIKSDPFWAEDVGVLFREDRLLEFFLNKDFVFEEKLNAIARLGVYISVIMALYKSDPKFLLLSLVTFGLTFFIKEFFSRNFYSPDIPDQFKENFTDNTKYIEPTIDNPYMNPSIVNPLPLPLPDYLSGSEDAKEIRKEIRQKSEHNLFKDVGDIFEMNNNRLSFHTVPRNDGKLKDFLFKDMKSGKVDQYYNIENKYYPLKLSNTTSRL